MQKRTPLQKLLVLLNVVLVLTILAIGTDLLVQQNNLSGKRSSFEDLQALRGELAVSIPSPPPEDLVPRVSTEKPTRLEIPTIGVFSDVVSVGVTEKNAMEVPNDGAKVGWYYPGVLPGQVGGAIMTAHYDTISGKPAAFFNLRKVNRGDLIYVTMANNQELLFQVQDVVSQPVSSFPTDLIFGNFPTKDLILITCDGIWNPLERSYSKRLVVFATIWRDNTL